MPKRHSLPVPERAAIGQGLFLSLLKQVCEAKKVTLEEKNC